MYGVLMVAIILRFTLNNDQQFEWARNVYTVALILFCLRILQLYLVRRFLGPKIIMLWRMVGIHQLDAMFFHYNTIQYNTVINLNSKTDRQTVSLI